MWREHDTDWWPMFGGRRFFIEWWLFGEPRLDLGMIRNSVPSFVIISPFFVGARDRPLVWALAIDGVPSFIVSLWVNGSASSATASPRPLDPLSVVRSLAAAAHPSALVSRCSRYLTVAQPLRPPPANPHFDLRQDGGPPASVDVTQGNYKIIMYHSVQKIDLF